MVFLLDYNEYVFLKKELIVKETNLSFYSHENACLKFVIKNNISKKIVFSINPLINAISFNPELIIKDSKIFELKINTSLLPKEWSGDLIIKDAGIINTVNLNFSKKELI
jgi:hypothetical protein